MKELCSDGKQHGNALASVEVARPHRRADQVDNQPSGGDAGDVVDVMLRRDLDEIHTDDPPLLDQTRGSACVLQER